MLTFTAWGNAAPKGSAKGFVVRSKATGKARAVVTHDNPRTKDWQQTIAHAANLAIGRQPHTQAPFFIEAGEAVRATAVFYLARPKSLRKKTNVHHTKKPDLDKLTRTVNDALTGIVWNDDAQIVDLQVRKRYAPPDTAPHVVITVQRAPVLG